MLEEFWILTSKGTSDEDIYELLVEGLDDIVVKFETKEDVIKYKKLCSVEEDSTPRKVKVTFEIIK